jgi:hypothetical protein
MSGGANIDPMPVEGVISVEDAEYEERRVAGSIRLRAFTEHMIDENQRMISEIRNLLYSVPAITAYLAELERRNSELRYLISYLPDESTLYDDARIP